MYLVLCVIILSLELLCHGPEVEEPVLAGHDVGGDSLVLLDAGQNLVQVRAVPRYGSNLNFKRCCLT